MQKFNGSALFGLVFLWLVLIIPTEGGRLCYLAMDMATTAYDYVKQWENLTGNTVTLIIRTQEEQPAEIEQDLTVDKLCDVYTKPYRDTIVPYATRDLVQDLTDYVRRSEFEWSSVSAVQRNFVSTYKKRTYSIPIDADPIVLYYRRDLITTPPSTWEELISVAAEYRGRDINGDGKPDFGTCVITEADMHILPYVIANTVFCYENSQRHHFMFDVSDDDTQPMRMLFQTAGWQYVFNITKRLFDLSQLFRSANGGGANNTFELIASGRCATIVSYPSNGCQTVAPPNGSYVRGRLGTARTPGSTLVYSRASKSMVSCNSNLCYYQESGGINRPHFAFPGIQLVVRKNTPNLEMALSFAAFASVKLDVRSPGALNPFRASQFDPAWFTRSTPVPWDLEDATEYTTALRNTLMKETTLSVPSIHNEQIIAASVRKALWKYLHIGDYNSNNEALSVILASLENDIVTQTIANGKSMGDIEEAFRIDMRLPALKPASSTNGALIAALVSSLGVVVLVIGAFCVYTFFILPRLKVAAAPKDPRQPFACAFVALKNETVLWEAFPDTINKASQRSREIVQSCAKKCECYVAKQIGGSFMVTSTTEKNITAFACAVQCALQAANFSAILGKSITTLRKEESQSQSQHNRRRTGGDNVSNSQTQERSSQASDKQLDDRSSLTHPHLMQMTFSVGAHFAAGRITFDSEHFMYEYTGPVVDGAAVISDVAQGWQILVSETSTTLGTTCNVGTIVEFAEFDVCRERMKLFQCDPSGLTPRTFAVPTAKESANVDSIAATLEQQTKGAAIKQITVLTVYCAAFARQLETASKEAFSQSINALFKSVEEVARQQKGYIQNFCGGRFVITFNVVMPTPQQHRRAYRTAAAIRGVFQEHQCSKVTCGIASGRALVGQFPMNSIGGDIAEQAVLLERMCRFYSGTTILTTSELMDELSLTASFRSVDIMHLPGTKKPQIMLSLEGERSGVDMNEWMYEVEAADAKDPYQELNRTYNVALTQGVAAAKQHWDEVHANVQQTLALGQIVDIMSRPSLEDYVQSRGALLTLFSD